MIPGASLNLRFPQEQQRRNHPEALKRDCPTCYAKAGEPCMPVSLSIPHLARCEPGDRGPRSAA